MRNHTRISVTILVSEIRDSNPISETNVTQNRHIFFNRDNFTVLNVRNFSRISRDRCLFR